MSRLHPTARALIDAARARETDLPEGARARVHQSVLRRAAVLGGAAAATTSASAAAKARVVAAVLAHPIVSSGAVAVLAAGFVVVHALWTPPPVAVPPVRAAVSAAATPAPMARRSPDSATQSPLKPPPVTRTTLSMLSPVAGEGPPTDGSLAPTTAANPHALPSTTVAPPPARAKRPGIRVSPTSGPADSREVPSGAERAPVASASELSSGDADERASPDRTDGTSAPVAASNPSVAAAPANSGTPLAVHVEVLRDVQAALRARQGRQALRLLEQHGAMLQSGPLAEEAQAARIAAYCQMGRAAEARAAIDKLPASWPRSPLTAAILRECDALRAAGPAN